MKIFAVTNPKGGVGKTTTIVALAALSARAGKKTLLVDLDSNRSATLLCAPNNSDKESKTAANLFCDEPKKLSDLGIPTEHGFDLLCGASDLVVCENWLRGQIGAEMRLRLMIENDEALSQYDHVYLDTAGRYGAMLNTALFAADEIIVPIKTSIASTDQLKQLFSVIADINGMRRATQRHDIKIAANVFTVVKDRTTSAERNIDDALDVIGEHFVSDAMIPDSTIVEDAWRARKPVPVFAPKHKVSLEYETLYSEIFGGAENREEAVLELETAEEV